MRNFSNILSFMLCTWLGLSATTEAVAQTARSYYFSQSMGTYTPITGGATTLIGTTDNHQLKVAIPGGFTFLGRTQDSVTINNNGHISFPNASNANSVANSTYGVISASLTNTGGAIAGFAADLQGYTNGEVRYEKVGNEFIVQWSNFRRYAISGDTLNFQIRLDQTTGTINIVYGHMTNGSSTSYQPEVGLRGVDTIDYNNRLVVDATGDWINSVYGTARNNKCYFNGANPNTKPSSGLTYTYTPATCYAPENIVVSNISTTGATVAWTPSALGDAPMEYEYYISNNNTLPATVTPTGAIAATSVALNNLQSATVYYIWVRSSCSATDFSSWSLATSFTTDCTPFAVPYIQDFESVTTPALPLCTSMENLGTGNAWATITALGSKGLRYAYNSTNAANVWFYTAGVQLTAGTIYRIHYKYAVSSATYSETMHIAAGLSPNATAMTHALISHVDFTNTAYMLGYVDFIAPSTDVYYFGFHANSAANKRNIYLDDIIVDFAPSCSEVLNFASSNLTTNSIDLSWTTPTYGATGDYEYYLSNTNTPPTAATTGVTVSGNATTLTGLTPNTTYYVWLRSLCNANEVSDWTNAITFTTYCTTTTVPYSQDFESVTTPTLPSCTSVERIGNGNTWATATALSSKVLRYSYNSSNAANTWFYTQGIELTAGTIYRISYKYAAYSTSNPERLTVAFGTAATATAMTNTLDAHIDFTHTTFKDNYIDFVAPTTDVYYFGFQAHSIANRYYIYVDNILVDYAPSCLPVTALTATNPTINSVTLNWTPSALSTSNDFEYYLSNTNTAPTATTQGVMVTGTSTVVTNLNAASTYYVWVRNVCSPTDAGVWSPMATFITDCIVANVPYLLDFNTTTASTIPVCTRVENLGNGNLWSAYTALGTTLLRYNYNSSNAANTWFYTQGINLQAGQSYRVSYKYATNSATYVESMKVGFGSSPAAASMSILMDMPTITTNSILKDTFVEFVPPTTGVYYVGFHAYSAANKLAIYVDDILVDKTPTCYTPTNVVLSNLTTTSIDVTFTAPVLGTTPTSYEYYLSTSSTTPTGTTTGVIVNATTITLDNLTPSTQYYLWVRTVCSSTDQSAWTPMSTFFTNYCVPTSTSTSYYINKVYSTGATQNISHATSTVVGYVDSSAAQLITVQEQTFTLTVDAMTGTHKYFIWVDWNNDMDFDDAGELIVSTTSFADSLVYTYNVDINAPVGAFRTRIATIFSGSTVPAPCGPLSNGTYFDFTLVIKERCPQTTTDLLLTHACGNSLGAATIDVNTNSRFPVTYLWSTGDTTPSINDLSIGNYSITVTPAPDCQIIDSFQIRSSLVAIATRPLSTDCGNAAASAEVVAVGSGFNYTWSTGDTMPVITGLAAGTYEVTVTDNICSKTATVEILHEDAFTLTANITNATAGNNDGKIEVNGPADATYLWATGENTSSIENLAIGTYEVTVLDVDGCSVTMTYEVQLSTGLNDVLLGEIALYPNPTTNLVNLAGAPLEAKVSLINNLGQVITVFNVQNDIEQIDLSQLSPSTYFLRIEHQNAVATLPVILIK